MGANLRIANTATLVLIGLQLVVPNYVGAVENFPSSTAASIVPQAENSDPYVPPDKDGPGATHGAGSR